MSLRPMFAIHVRVTALLIVAAFLVPSARAAKDTPPANPQNEENADLRRSLDFPILFTQRPNYQGIHIYDTCYKWYPGGGIYVLENPSDPPAEHRVRAVIDPNTPETLGGGIYFDPELSFDAKRVLFSHKGEPDGSSSIYEINIDGTGLRRLTDPTPHCADYHGSHGGVHDLTPAYLPDGRIVFTSTRQQGLVPCANKGVAILHVMNADGSDLHTISVNSETEFDPSMLEDGRILFGRWEYVDKTALTQQSIWTVCPDGRNEEALYANNMVFPEAVLDARQVPGAPHLICASFTPHNSTPRGTIAMIDTRLGKNDPAAIFNFDKPDDPTNNRGDSCEPWPLDEHTVLYSTMVDGKNVLMLAKRSADGTIRRCLVHREAIDCHTPIPVVPRPVPQRRPEMVDRSQDTGFFTVQDVYVGMPEVPRGSIKKLRVIEETSRVSASPGGSIYNQTFSVSAALAFACKNYLGTVPVEEDGSAHFEVPAGKAIYLQALDAEGRCVRSMRTFIQAAPGVTRSCIGCHEDKKATYPAQRRPTIAQRRLPSRLEEESWGSGPLDYASMVQPVLDAHCVECHGGDGGIACGLDLTGGWTDFFTISYENLTSRRKVQYKSTLIAGIDCMNGTALYSAQILPAYSHGSTAAPLAEVLVDGARGHEDRFDDMPRRQRDLLLAWIDTNGLFNGTWDYTEQGCRLDGWQDAKAALQAEMKSAGCTECHAPGHFEADWFNLRTPEHSRILRAPMAKQEDGLGLGLCPDRKVDGSFRRLRIMSTGRYQHAVMPLDDFPKQEWRPWDESGTPVVSFDSTEDAVYRNMLEIIRSARARALASPRVDMPGARPIAGESRNLYPLPIPEPLPPVEVRQLRGGEMEIIWPRNKHTWGLTFHLYRGETPDFPLDQGHRLATTKLCRYLDTDLLPEGEVHYAIVMENGQERSVPIRAAGLVQAVPPPRQVGGLRATAAPGCVRLSWNPVPLLGARYHVAQAPDADGPFVQLTDEPIAATEFVDLVAAEWKGRESTLGEETKNYPPTHYRVWALNRRGDAGTKSEPISAAAQRVPVGPIFQTSEHSPDSHPTAAPHLKAKVIRPARYREGKFLFLEGGRVEYPHHELFELGRGPGLSVECSVRLDAASGEMPVLVSAGHWNRAGWFLQQIGDRWRWHVGGVDCDGGTKPAPDEWVRLRATFDGRKARLYQNGELVAEVPCRPDKTPWNGPLMIGQYSGAPGPQYQVRGMMKDIVISLQPGG